MKPFTIRSLVSKIPDTIQNPIESPPTIQQTSPTSARFNRSANMTSNATITLTGFKRAVINKIHVGFFGAFSAATVNYVQFSLKIQGSGGAAEKRIVRVALNTVGGNHDVDFSPPFEGLDDKTDLIMYVVGAWPANSMITADIYGYEL